MATLKIYGQKKKKPVVHKGVMGCMNVAFYFVKDIVKGRPIKATDIELLNGSTPKSGDPIICGACGRNIANLSAAGWCE